MVNYILKRKRKVMTEEQPDEIIYFYALAQEGAVTMDDIEKNLGFTRKETEQAIMDSRGALIETQDGVKTSSDASVGDFVEALCKIDLKIASLYRRRSDLKEKLRDKSSHTELN
jgi:hypothetical protein